MSMNKIIKQHSAPTIKQTTRASPHPVYSMLGVTCMSWCCDISSLRTASLPKGPNISTLNLGGTGDVQTAQAPSRAHILMLRSLVRQQSLSCKYCIECFHLPHNSSTCILNAIKFLVLRSWTKRCSIVPATLWWQWQNTWEDHHIALSTTATLETPTNPRFRINPTTNPITKPN